MQETAKCRRKRARVQAGGADTVIAQYFSGAAMQKDGGKRRFKRRHALRDQRANQAAEHIAAAAGRQSGMAGWIERVRIDHCWRALRERIRACGAGARIPAHTAADHPYVYIGSIECMEIA